MYIGFWGRKMLLAILIIGILICVYFSVMGDRIMTAVSVSGNIFFWIGFFSGMPEGVAQGRRFEKEDIEARKKY